MDFLKEESVRLEESDSFDEVLQILLLHSEDLRVRHRLLDFSLLVESFAPPGEPALKAKH